MELSMPLSYAVSRSGEGDWAPMPWIQALILTLAGFPPGF